MSQPSHSTSPIPPRRLVVKPLHEDYLLFTGAGAQKLAGEILREQIGPDAEILDWRVAPPTRKTHGRIDAAWIKP